MDAYKKNITQQKEALLTAQERLEATRSFRTDRKSIRLSTAAVNFNFEAVQRQIDEHERKNGTFKTIT